MLALNNSCPEKCPEWNSFFVESLASFIVNYSYPQGSLDEINVAWITRMFATDGIVNSELELELVLHIMEISSHVPDELRAFALDQLRLAITDDVGSYKLARAVDRRGVTRQDVDFIMRVLQEYLRGRRDSGWAAHLWSVASDRSGDAAFRQSSSLGRHSAGARASRVCLTAHQPMAAYRGRRASRRVTFQ